MNESYSGIGRKDKRWMVKRWKQAGTNLSLKQWAKLQGVGDVADVWIKAKASK